MGGPGSGRKKGSGGKSFAVGAFRAGGRSYGPKVKQKVSLTPNQKSQKANDAKLRKAAKTKKMFPGRG